MAEELIIELDEEVYAQCEEICCLQGVDIGKLLGGWVKWIALPRKKMEVHAFYRKANPVSSEVHPSAVCEEIRRMEEHNEY